MEAKWCFDCGASNPLVAETCANCGAALPDKDEYRAQFLELNEFREVKKDYGPGNLIGILVGILIVWIVSNLIFIFLLPPTSGDSWEAWARTWIIPIVIILMFFGVFVPRLVKWIRVRKRRHWTADQRRVLAQHLKIVPASAFATVSTIAVGPQTASTGTGNPVTTPASPKSNAPGCGVIAAIMVFVGIVIYIVFSSTGSFKPESILSWLNLPEIGVTDEQTATVSGRYEAYFAGGTGGGGELDGVMAEQTWWYDFFPDGTFTTYIDGYQQFSGTWSQSGNVLTINTPAIPEGGISAQNYTATVAPDASSFTTPDSTWNRVPN